MLNWETHIIIGWWFDLVVFKEVVVNSIRGRALLGLLAQEFCWDCIFLRILEFYVKSFGVWNIHVNFGGIWFVIRIICTYVIKFWLILWRDEYVYLFYHMERKKKSLTISLEGLVSGVTWINFFTSHPDMSSFENSKHRIRNQEFVNGKNKNRVKIRVGLKLVGLVF